MDKKILFILGAVLLFGLMAVGVNYYLQENENKDVASTTEKTTEEQQKPKESVGDEQVIDSTSYESEKGVTITVTSPVRGGKVSSPLQIAGSVPGSWSHEGQFSVRLLDAQSTVVAEGPAKLSGDWMTENAVPFSGTLSYSSQPSGTGLLVLVKANPSDLAENSDSVTIPIEF